ncbi:MAG: PorV/PorQ family protein [Elusimicrobiota bacterium]
MRAKGPGSSAYEFLIIPVGSREVGMGSGTAVAHGPNAFWWNPAGLCYLDYKCASLMYNMWFEGISQQRAGYSFPMKGNSYGSVNISMLSVSGIEGYSWHDVPTGEVTSKDYYFSYTQGKRLSPELAAGITLKSIIEQLDEDRSFAFAFDLGVIYEPSEGIWIAGGVRNLGKSGKFDIETAPLPLTLFSGLGIRINRFILVSSDVQYLNSELKYGAGTEVSIWDLGFLRAGYNNVADIDESFSIGAGWKWLDISVDYAYAPYGKLGNTNRFDITVRFGKLTLVESIYRNARSLYKNKSYKQAWIEFNKVDSLSPEYKRVRIWLENTTKQMEISEQDYGN